MEARTALWHQNQGYDDTMIRRYDDLASSFRLGYDDDKVDTDELNKPA